MSELTFYSYPSCTSCRKTKHWLKAHNVDFQERHLFKDTPNLNELKKILSLTTEGIDEILATRSQTYKELNVDINELSLSEVLKLLIKEPKLLRRPIITDGSKLIIGYSPQQLSKVARKHDFQRSVS
ncbi:Spx/MgsR family RNA polymerase-binding regulatory protein [Bacillus weihaiensis]|uniref:Transcriptional regulator n=1 Tax=Bacillus weihaiensis TaxID=1547283 RepID=A0A1L3MPY0_9BACI|nr:Spx/MgsR family RNA polymerase-binding regulatory protein [Bacillus weihaiensis]APH04398.1 transcriptional regulator [Bacillus weihaiensis]